MTVSPKWNATFLQFLHSFKAYLLTFGTTLKTKDYHFTFRVQEEQQKNVLFNLIYCL
jgi:hypothetical protein